MDSPGEKIRTPGPLTWQREGLYLSHYPGHPRRVAGRCEQTKDHWSWVVFLPDGSAFKQGSHQKRGIAVRGTESALASIRSALAEKKLTSPLFDLDLGFQPWGVPGKSSRDPKT